MRFIRAFLIASGIMLGLRSCDEFWFGPHWTLDRIEATLGADIPADATNITFNEDERVRYGNITLSFEASPGGAESFAAGICGGLLHPGYDPFASVDTENPLPGSVLIKDFNTHYSYSPGTPDTISGNRCRGSNGLFHQIRVARNGDIATISFRQDSACQPDDYPCSALAAFANPLLGSGLPFMVVGAEQIGDEVVVVYDELCMETRLDHPFRVSESEQDDLSPFIGAEVGVLIDGQPMPPAHISEERQLEPADPAGASEWLFDYCLPVDWPAGVHTMTLRLHDEAGTDSTFEWSFRVPE